MALQLRQVDQIIRVQEAPLSERLLQLLLEPSRFRGGFDLEVAQEAGEACIRWQRALSEGGLLRDLRRAMKSCSLATTIFSGEHSGRGGTVLLNL